MSVALEEELRVLDLVFCLSYYFAFLDCISLFLHFLTSLIKFSLWNLGEASEGAKAFLQTRVRGLGQEEGLSLEGPSDLLSSGHLPEPLTIAL